MSCLVTAYWFQYTIILCIIIFGWGCTCTRRVRSCGGMNLPLYQLLAAVFCMAVMTDGRFSLSFLLLLFFSQHRRPLTSLCLIVEPTTWVWRRVTLPVCAPVPLLTASLWMWPLPLVGVSTTVQGMEVTCNTKRLRKFHPLKHLSRNVTELICIYVASLIGEGKAKFPPMPQTLPALWKVTRNNAVMLVVV